MFGPSKELLDKVEKIDRTVHGGGPLYNVTIVGSMKTHDAEPGLRRRVVNLENEVERLKDLLSETIDFVYGSKDDKDR